MAAGGERSFCPGRPGGTSGGFAYIISGPDSRGGAGVVCEERLNDEGSGHWWYGGQHLYEVFLKPIYFGPAAENRLLGFLVIGYEIDDRVAAQVSRIAASQVAFYYGDAVVKTTLNPMQEAELDRQRDVHAAPGASGPEQIQLGEERFLITSLELAGGKNSSVRLNVLKSYDQATAFLDSLNRLLLALGLAAVLGGSALVFLHFAYLYPSAGQSGGRCAGAGKR